MRADPRRSRQVGDYRLGSCPRHLRRLGRDAALAFWRHLQAAYTYVTGGSSFQEEWRAHDRGSKGFSWPLVL